MRAKPYAVNEEEQEFAREDKFVLLAFFVRFHNNRNGTINNIYFVNNMCSFVHNEIA